MIGMLHVCASVSTSVSASSTNDSRLHSRQQPPRSSPSSRSEILRGEGVDQSLSTLLAGWEIELLLIYTHGRARLGNEPDRRRTTGVWTKQSIVEQRVAAPSRRVESHRTA